MSHPWGPHQLARQHGTVRGRAQQNRWRGAKPCHKETRESIEAELNASKRERIALQLLEMVSEAQLVEKDLRAIEDEHGIPEFARSRPLPERMAAFRHEP